MRGLPGTRVSRVFIALPAPHCITGTLDAEPDACLGTWQATGAAAISKLCHDLASDVEPPPERSGQL